VKGDIENLTLTGTGAINGTGNTLDNIIVGNDGANKLDGGLGADTLSGGLGADTVAGGGGDDQIDAVDGNDTVRFTSALDGHDVIANFDGNATDGQDKLDLDALFDGLGVAAANRAARVEILDNGTTVDVRVDADGNAGNGFEYTLATLNTADDITVGADVIVGT
jgi:Ca2+-binding RTX toxin-like protein